MTALESSKRIWNVGEFVQTSLRRYRITHPGSLGWFGVLIAVATEGGWREVSDGSVELLFQSGEWTKVAG